jgi:hypothetical protein
MKYDEEYNSYKFSKQDMEIILDALSFYHSRSTNVSQCDPDYIDGLFQSLENSGVDHAGRS